jgi:hypothetical protein
LEKTETNFIGIIFITTNSKRNLHNQKTAPTAPTTILVLRGRTDVAIQVNSNSVFRAANTMLLVLHGKMDVAIRVNSKLVFKVSNIMVLVLHDCLENKGSAQ